MQFEEKNDNVNENPVSSLDSRDSILLKLADIPEHKNTTKDLFDRHPFFYAMLCFAIFVNLVVGIMLLVFILEYGNFIIEYLDSMQDILSSLDRLF